MMINSLAIMLCERLQSDIANDLERTRHFRSSLIELEIYFDLTDSLIFKVLLGPLSEVSG